MKSTTAGSLGAASPMATTPVLTRELLDRQQDLNLDYLDLVIAEQAFGGGLACRFPDRVLEGLMECTFEQRQALAATAFSLYSLGFEEQYFWQSALRRTALPVEARYRVPGSVAMETAFCEVALVHAWHVAVTRPIAARMLYGMPTTLANRMSFTQLWQLKRIAADHPGLLMPRWPSNPRFWPDMIRFARAGDLQRLDTAQQLGHQLMATELQASAAHRSATHQRQQHLLLQRLKGA